MKPDIIEKDDKLTIVINKKLFKKYRQIRIFIEAPKWGEQATVIEEDAMGEKRVMTVILESGIWIDVTKVGRW